MYGGVVAVLIAGVNTIWGGIAADWASYYFTAFNFLVGPIFIAITGNFLNLFILCKYFLFSDFMPKIFRTFRPIFLATSQSSVR